MDHFNDATTFWPQGCIRLSDNVITLLSGGAGSASTHSWSAVNEESDSDY